MYIRRVERDRTSFGPSLHPFNTFSTMPQALDSQFDQLIEQYTDHVCDSMDIGSLLDMARDRVMEGHEKMTEHELMNFIEDMEGKEFATDLIGSIYGNYPVTDQEIEGRDYTMKEGESITFPSK